MTSAIILNPWLSRSNLTRPQRLQAIARQAPEPLYAREPPPLGLASGSTIRMRSTLRSAWRSAFALAAITLGASISGCAVGPDYETPAMSLSSFHSVGGVLTRGNNSPPPLDTWWTGFNDRTLTRIIRRALEQNLDLAASLARVEQARAAAQEAGAQLLPTSNLTGQVTNVRQSLESPIGAIGKNLPGFERNISLFDPGISASWEIDLFGGLRRGAEAASAEAEAAEAARLGTRISVAADAGDAYFQIRGDQARIAAIEDQVAADARLLDLVRLRFARGLASTRETAQAEALLYQARTALQPLRVDLEAQLNRLDILMGAQPGTYASELRSPANIPAIPRVYGGDKPMEVLRRRPDVVAAERRVASSNARIGEAISGYYPKISISGLLGFESMSVSHLFRSTTFQPQVVSGLRWRLFDFGKIDAEVAQAEGAQAEALARYRQSILHAAEDVENAFTALVQSQAHTNELQREIAALKRSRDLAQDAYRAGAIPLTDVLDADRQLLVAKDEFFRSRADTARAAVRSFRALGGMPTSEEPATGADQSSAI
jgi:NodT family efflux transporter outer membrane factor (OMF) lipoprotein